MASLKAAVSDEFPRLNLHGGLVPGGSAAGTRPAPISGHGWLTALAGVSQWADARNRTVSNEIKTPQAAGEAIHRSLILYNTTYVWTDRFKKFCCCAVARLQFLPPPPRHGPLGRAVADRVRGQ